MRVTAYGAAGEVTGSCHLLEAGGKRVLVDCGQFQGGDHSYDRSAEPFPFDPRSIDAVVLTHGHLDHIGRLPLLVKSGFDGPIYATG
ncbi:MAG: MBL fold metallo-hydrolase, partial [Dehalococcoidia bacterium]|nr:MBL fold metallo-hydrolase [Dehalococcoidia bacterium]